MLYNTNLDVFNKKKKKIMKKIIMLLMFVLTSSLGLIKSNESRTVIPQYKQTQVLKTIFIDIPYTTKWIKQDTGKVILDFIDNKKIIIKNLDYKNIYHINKIDSVNYDFAKSYKMMATDNKNNNFNIEVLYFKNKESVMLSIFDEFNIVRYRF